MIQRAVLHPGYADPEHVYLQCEADIEVGDDCHIQHEVYRLARRMVTKLRREQEAFRSSAWISTSLEPRMIGPIRVQSMGTGFGRSIVLTPESIELDISRLASTDPNLWHLGTAADIPDETAAVLLDPVNLAVLGEVLGRILADEFRAKTTDLGSLEILLSPKELKPRQRCLRAQDIRTQSKSALELQTQNSPSPGRLYPELYCHAQQIPIIHKADVLVVGGGSSGIGAAIAAASTGVDTILLDMNPGLGGTGTWGGVDSYWYGRRVGFARKLSDRISDGHQRFGNHKDGSRWNLEARRQVLLEQCEQAGVKVLFPVLAVASLMDGQRVRGVLISWPGGFGIIQGEIVVDATGDGDIAAFAGARYCYGAGPEGLPMWYSLAMLKAPGVTRNNFTSAVNIADVNDYTRAILVGRRRGVECVDHGIYVASRESRHILGEYTIDLEDLLRFKKHDDTIALCYSNYDLKGMNVSSYIRLGILPPDMVAEIPYRSVIPKGLDNIYVVGKAISATHCAFPGLRMQADLENLGAAIGRAAALAVELKVGPRGIPVRELQSMLVKDELLPAHIVERVCLETDIPGSTLRGWVADPSVLRLTYTNVREDEIVNGVIPVVELLSRKESIPWLEQAFDRAECEDEKLTYAQLLAWFGIRRGADVLIERVKSALESGLASREVLVENVNTPPDQGAMPEIVHMIYSIGMSGDPKGLDVLQIVVPRIQTTEEAFLSKSLSLFDYIEAACFVAERIGGSSVPWLKELHRKQNLNGQMKYDVRHTVDWIQERKAYLELRIGTALARLCCPDGFEILIAYLGDCRVVLSDYAYQQLRELTQQDFGKQPLLWSMFLSQKQVGLANK